MLSRTTEYALRAVIYLAGANGEKTTAQTIAEATRVPEGYMSKVLNTLARAGIVDSQRGPSGGFTLNFDPEDLTMLRVVEAVEPLPRLKSCPLTLDAHTGELCPLHAVLAGLVRDVETKLTQTRIADLLTSRVKPLGLSPACRFPGSSDDAQPTPPPTGQDS